MSASVTKSSRVCAVLALSWPAVADPPQLYELLPHSVFMIENCLPPCVCPSHGFSGGIQGSFFLTLDHSDPLFDHYDITSVNWVSTATPEPSVLTGSGTYRIGGEVAVMHQMELALNVNGQFDTHADSGLVLLDHQAPFPFIGIRIVTERFACSQITIDLDARPDRCPADLNHSGDVSLEDLAILLAHFGREGGATHEQGDLDGDADVDLADLSALLAHFGQVCPP